MVKMCLYKATSMKTLTMDTPFAVLSDVHGNLPALEAVLADIERRGVRATLCLGDLVGYGPHPNEVARLVRDRGIPTLMGNYDQGIGQSTGQCGCSYKTDAQRAEGAVSLEWTQAEVADDVRAYLRTLEDHFTLQTPAGALLAVHGSPRRINEYLFEDRPESAMRRMAEAYPYRAILFGHTHLPYARRVGKTTFINVGSAGRPKDGDWRACYAVVDPAGGGGAAPAVEFARVRYDHEALLAAVAATDLITTFAGPDGRDT